MTLFFCLCWLNPGAGIIVGDEATLVTLNEPLSVAGNYDAAKMWVSVLVLTVTVALMAMDFKGAPLFGIALGTAITWIECWASGAEDSVFLYPFDSCGSVRELGLNGTDCFCYAPRRAVALPQISTAGAFQFQSLRTKEFWVAVITFYFNDIIGEPKKNTRENLLTNRIDTTSKLSQLSLTQAAPGP